MEENNISSQEKETLIPESNKEESEDKLKEEYIKTQINLSKNLKKESDEYLKSNQFPKKINKYSKALIIVKDVKKKKLLTRLKKENKKKKY